MKTRFRHATGQQLYIETATLIQVIMQSAFVIGPIIGGYLSYKYDTKSAATIMAVVSTNIVAIYAICALLVHCFTKWDQQPIVMTDDSQSEVSFNDDAKAVMTSDAEFRLDMQALRKKRKKDELGTLL